MSDHRLDVISLFGGVVFLSFGLVGLLHAAGWIDARAPLWVVVIGLGALGACGVGLSLASAVRDSDTSLEPGLDAGLDPGLDR